MTCAEKVDPRPYGDLEKIFHPKSIAVVGVSPSNPLSFGSLALTSLLLMKCESRIYPVNPNGGLIEGLKVYKAIEDIPEPIDFAVILVPAPLVPAALEACRLKGAVGAEIISSGFKETGTPEGIALEEEIKKIAKKGIRVIGPNCFGVYCPSSGLTIVPGPDLPRKSGDVAFLSQSGGMANDFSQITNWIGFNISKLISFGNGADLREVGLMQYLCGDPETEVIAMYIEGVDNGRDFFTTLRDVCSKKPVVIHKGGLSDAGGRAVATHTASLGGSKKIWTSLLRQCNAVQVHDLNEMVQASLAFSLLPHRRYKGMTVIGGGGALGVGACDAAENFNFDIPRLQKNTVETILSVLPRPGSSGTNPIDSANPYVSPEALKTVLLSAAEDPRVNIQILMQQFYYFRSIMRWAGGKSLKDFVFFKELADVVAEVIKITGKPVVIVTPNYKREPEAMEIESVTREAKKCFLERGILVLDSLNDALRAIKHVSTYWGKRIERGQP